MPEKNKTVALLLNLFVMPGAGHVYLGNKKKGYALSFITVVILFGAVLFFEWSLYLLANEAKDPFSSIFTLTKTAFYKHASFYLSSLVFVVLVWIYGIVDLFKSPST